MNKRVRKTRFEPDDPVESEVVSVERLEPSEAGDAFRPHGGFQERVADGRYVSKLEDALESGEWVAFRTVYRTYIPRIWQYDHFEIGPANESTRHKLLKILAAEFLDQCGHEMPKIGNELYDGSSEHNRDWIYDPRCFEASYDPGIADLTCECEDCSTYVEVGRVAAKKWYKASQYRGLETLVVIPYATPSDLGHRGEERYVYQFHRLEEPDGPTPIHPSGL